jgi:hypothetical protein
MTKDFWEGYVPEPTVKKSLTVDALKLALDALESCDQVYGSEGSYQYFSQSMVDKAITAIKQALANEALDKKAENARELGLDYEPDYKVTVVDDQHPNGVPLEQWGRPAPVQEPVAWMPITEPYPPGDELDILMGDGSVLCGLLPQADGDLWWEGSGTGEKFIDPKYANVTHWRIHSDTTPPAAPVVDCHATGVCVQSGLRAEMPAPVQNIEHCIWARNGNTPCPHTTPPAAQRQWVGLSEEEIDEIFNNQPGYCLDHYIFAEDVISKYEEKNAVAQLVVPDVLNPKDENPAYAAGWNDCRAEMLKGMK